MNPINIYLLLIFPFDNILQEREFIKSVCQNPAINKNLQKFMN